MDSFLIACTEANAEPSPTGAIREVLREHLVGFGRHLPPPTRAELTMLCHSDELTVLAGWWTPGLSLGPHDHRLWLVAGVFEGVEDNALYQRDKTGVAASGGRRLEAGQVLSLGPHGIHAVCNPTNSWTGVVQVYGGDLFATPRSQFDPLTLEEAPFDYSAAAAQLDHGR